MKITCVSCFVASLVLVVGCAMQPKYGAFEPKGELAPSSPAAYDSYGKAMAHVDGYRMAYEWQQKDKRAIAEATRPEVLAAVVESDAAADALLAKVGTAYDGDPVVLTQIAAVTQFVMCPKCPQPTDRRKIWAAALERTRATTEDGYVRTFCDQQLRLCR